MKAHRAQEIIQSQDKIEVKLNGVPVWIDSIDASQQTAKVHAEGQPGDTRVVALEELQELQ
ncbi:H-type small acid-soluble spore protein [Paenibacillus filicis]|uniref:H-type small acid-soluble spore protein n=1 Tax=Paenibacillus gyeongsangnamensis TaxID=3388067 RepID=A0ABT4QFL5_9BACL|nr:H-type small acid-soluble spore protein [Paenibacillus filicis]MCZ8515673.1 H-type small acid-soluble spore protein [Paenibacillus filicis]